MRKQCSAALAVLGLAVAATAVAESSAPIPASVQPQLIYVSYYVLDQQRALDFYVGLLGMSERQRITPSPGVTEILLGFDKNPASPGVLLMHRADRKAPYTIGDGYSRTLIHVNDIQSVMARLAEAGVKILTPATEIKALKLSYSMVRDPDGYLIEFIQSENRPAQ